MQKIVVFSGKFEFWFGNSDNACGTISWTETCNGNRWNHWKSYKDWPVFTCIHSQQSRGSIPSIPMPFDETGLTTQASGFFIRLRSLGSPTKIYIKVLRPPSFWLWWRAGCSSMRELRTQFFKNHLAGCSPCFLDSAVFSPFVLLAGGFCRFQSSLLQ